MDQAGGEGEEGVVSADAYVFAGVVFGAALANDDVAGYYFLTAIYFNAQPLALGLAAVFYFSFAFFVCHVVSIEILVLSIEMASSCWPLAAGFCL
jgi:hypothetical protein